MQFSVNHDEEFKMRKVIDCILATISDNKEKQRRNELDGVLDEINGGDIDNFYEMENLIDDTLNSTIKDSNLHYRTDGNDGTWYFYVHTDVRNTIFENGSE